MIEIIRLYLSLQCLIPRSYIKIWLLIRLISSALLERRLHCKRDVQLKPKSFTKRPTVRIAVPVAKTSNFLQMFIHRLIGKPPFLSQRTNQRIYTLWLSERHLTKISDQQAMNRRPSFKNESLEIKKRLATKLPTARIYTEKVPLSDKAASNRINTTSQRANRLPNDLTRKQPANNLREDEVRKPPISLMPLNHSQVQPAQKSTRGGWLTSR